ncbi:MULTISPECIES: aliphatic sulfonate ABC transporter substrate-binding protein [unclassified Xanthomonas]|uniref:aliphatic sulfonate ABC transporter substrate-binding protein n=1 Tax=unclassified Xanthomonas TaxID=2643310 RepID=UPI000CEF41AC|nr:MULTISPECIES: aliphatic sulfonate ABC transporter substrate-binding protein [unclassified Xanthomonas]PPU31884.1 ABC transporter substrate-binding protein [Xanthomonas sp. CFBP 7912]RJS03855.1 ABC transporter substrate-binding protein [Xanthomonas sp. CFBP 7698]
MKRRNLLKLGTLAGVALGSSPLLSRAAFAQAKRAVPKQLRLDYAYYSPTSLVLKHFGWLEQALKAQGTAVTWVLSAGSNRALEYLAGNSIDFASTAGLAALLARANGNPVKAVYVYSRPEWVALAVGKRSPIQRVAELKGKRIAATKGTDAYLFLLRALRQAGLDKNAVNIVHLQHADGRTALERGDVDAWSGLDPHLAASQIEASSRLIYRNVAFNSYGFLNTSEAFAAAYPAQIPLVLQAYEKARRWAIEHPDALVGLIAEEARVSLPVAKLQLQRNDFSRPLIGAEQHAALQSAAPILLEEGLVRPGTDLSRVLATLIDASYAKRAHVAQG